MRTIRIRKVFGLLLLLSILAACQRANPTTSPLESPLAPQQSPIQTSTPAPVILATPGQPEDDQATMYGQVIRAGAGTDAPIPGVAVRLAEVYREGDSGAFVLDDAFSPATLTDDNGWFVIENAEPGEYVIVVGDMSVAYEIITKESGDAKVWELRQGEVLDIGVLEVTLN